MNLQIPLILLIGVIAALNANLKEDSDSYDSYEEYDEYLMRFKGMQTIFFC